MKVKDALEILLQMDPELPIVMADMEEIKLIEQADYGDGVVVISDMDGTEEWDDD